MRILHWTESFHPRIGGMEVFVRHLAHYQQDRGQSCLILTGALPGQPERDEVLGIPIWRLDFQKPIIERSLNRIRQTQQQVERILSDYAPDVIHLHTSQASAFYFARIPNNRRRASVYTSHDGIQEAWHTGSSLLAQILQRVDRVTAPSKFVRLSLSRLMPSIEAKLRLVYGSLPFPAAAVEPQQSVHTVLAFGRLVPEKGFDLFLQALAMVQASHPNLRAVVAGDGPEQAALRELARELGLQRCVHFTGWVEPDDMSAIIGASSLVVVPSRWQEPFGLAALQAMQLGRPVIAARVGGLPEIIEHGQTGCLVAPDDATSLAEAIIALLDNPEQQVAWGQNAVQRAATVFDWTVCAEAMTQLYGEIAN